MNATAPALNLLCPKAPDSRTPMKKSSRFPSLMGLFAHLAPSATPLIESINDQWERVVHNEAPDPAAPPTSFGRVSVEIP